MTSAHHQPKRHSETFEADSDAKDLLCYADQSFFTLLRALRRQPLLHFAWIYPHPIDEAAVNAFNARLSQGFLGRLVQRSPLPWGRHRWVANHLPAPVTWFRTPIPIAQLPEWRTSLLDLTVDPEHGPGWRLAVQSLDNGGTALALIVSHTIADGKAANQAVADAVTGRPLDFKFPAPSCRWSPAMMIRDSVESIRALPSVWRALRGLVKQSRAGFVGGTRLPSRLPQAKINGSDAAVNVPLVQVVMDQQSCENRASELGVGSNTLLTAIAARLAFRIGRVDAEGRVELALPVSNRKPGDWRGNAFQVVTVMADPKTCHTDPRALRDDVRMALASKDQQNNDWTPLLPLIPYVPLWLLRKMETRALGGRLPVGCSLLGELPQMLDHPCGEATLVQKSSLEWFKHSLLERVGGFMMLLGYRIGGKVLFTVACYAPNRVTTRDELTPIVQGALADLGLDGMVS